MKNLYIDTNRIDWMDYAKAFSIIAVVLNHTSIYPEIKHFVYLMCLPAFFLIAGVFTHTQLTPVDFFKKNTLRLLVPYFVFGIFSWLAWLFIGRYYGADADSDYSWWLPLIGLICGKEEMLIANPPLWFLSCMISLEWSYYIICCCSNKWARWAIIICLGVLGSYLSYLGKNWPWEISASFIILPLYSLGAELSSFFKTTIRTYKLYVYLIILVVSGVGLWIGYTYNEHVSLHISAIGNPLFYYLTVSSVVGIWSALSILLERMSKCVSLLLYYGKNTIIILCVHIPLFGAIKGAAMLCGVSLSFFATNIGSIALWLSSLILLFPLIYIINRFFPFLVGKRRSTP